MISGYLCHSQCQDYPAHFQPNSIAKQNISFLPFIDSNFHLVIHDKTTVLKHLSQHSPPKQFEGGDQSELVSPGLITCPLQVGHLGNMKAPKSSDVK
jgi:hypothetical protein